MRFYCIIHGWTTKVVPGCTHCQMSKDRMKETIAMYNYAKKGWIEYPEDE